METIKNFSKCNLNEVYTINGQKLIIAEVSVKQSGSCKHNLYTGTLDGEAFNELNSPQLKRLIGIDTLEYERGGGDGTPRTSRKEITPELIDAEINKYAEKTIKLVEQLKQHLGESDEMRLVSLSIYEIEEEVKDEMRKQLEERMMLQMAAKASREAKAKDAEKDEARKQLCAELGTTLSAVKKMAEAMGASVDEMIQNLQAMKK